MEYFIQEGYSASDVQLFSLYLERDINSLRIKLEPKPDYSSHQFVIDEAAFKQRLAKEISYHDPDGITLQRDLDSISAIMRLRKGRETDIIEECVAVFITMNSELARVGRQFFFEERFPYAVSPCLTDYTLTNMLWLKKPLEAPDLPRKRIIADYYAAIQPEERVLKEYYSEIEKLEQEKKITRDDYYLSGVGI